VVGSGRRCAQGGRDRASKRAMRTGVHGGDDDDDLSLLAGDESDGVRGRVIGGVCGLLCLNECVECPGERIPFTPPSRASRLEREQLMDRGIVQKYHGVHGSRTHDNVRGCVRDLVVPLGERGETTGWWESDGLPRSGERVALCSERRCVGFPTHPADLDGLFCLFTAPDPDVVKRGVLYVSSACHRTCSSCGVTYRNRELLSLCLGCHAMAPFVRSGASDDADIWIEDSYYCTPAYCSLSCQESHWHVHRPSCPRLDVTLHAATCRTLGFTVRPYGRLVAGGARIPYLARSTTDQPGAMDGCGNT